MSLPRLLQAAFATLTRLPPAHSPYLLQVGHQGLGLGCHGLAKVSAGLHPDCVSLWAVMRWERRNGGLRGCGGELGLFVRQFEWEDR